MQRRHTHIDGQEKSEGLTCYQKYLNVLHEFAQEQQLEQQFENQSNYTNSTSPISQENLELSSMIPNPWDDRNDGVVNNMGS